MNLATVRRNELAQQRAALSEEFVTWRKRTVREHDSDPRPPLEKHHSQITRITGELEAYLQANSLPDATQDDSIDDFAAAQNVVNGIQRVWAYYREKFALRDVEWLRNDLACADELAWHCYEPAVKAARAAGTVKEGELKEPPLVFYDPSSSPFAVSRGRFFKPEGLTTEEQNRLDAAILELPIPVIGVPWFQVSHLPLAVAIAHEVGHAVWWDFSAEAPLRDAFKNMPLAAPGGEQRRGGWSAWLSELFADAYAVVALGAPFVLGLSDYLADRIDAIRLEQLGSAHPPALLRIKINSALLKELRKGDEGVGAAWSTIYQHDSRGYEQDVETIAKTLLNTKLPKFGNKAIRRVLEPPATEDMDEIAKNISNPNGSLRDNPDFRLLFAGASLLFHRDPDAYAAVTKDGALLRRFAGKIRAGTRSLGLTKEQRSQQAVTDRATASRIFDALTGQPNPQGGN